MEAGNRCFDQRVPEEINRTIVDHIADINLPYSTIAREYLLREGLPPDRVIKTGSPLQEVLEHYKERIARSRVTERLGVKPCRYVVVSAHREENVDDKGRLGKLIAVLEAVAERFDEPIIVSTHPRTQKRIDSFRLKLAPQVKLIKPLGYTDYVSLQIQSRAVLSDSGTITEEASILNFPAINLRDSHERPEGVEEGTVVMTGLETDRVLQALDIVQQQSRRDHRTIQIVSDYAARNVSEKVARIILGYRDYVMRTVWHE
jgi:UDP-N-acetylglucosamine 2-epimerase (non-hydrolysing)